MAVDLYVGTLSRYYSGSWENVGQKWARENHVAYKIVRPADAEADGELPKLDPAAMQTAVTDWREVMIEGLGAHLQAPLEWDESPETPYFTDRPHWDGYAALMILAACEENADIDIPETVPGNWSNHPALVRARSDEFAHTDYMHLLSPEMWLPGDFSFTFQFVDLAGRTITIGSVERLLDHLRHLNERVYRATEEERLIWRQHCPPAGAPFDQAARFGLGVFLDLAEQAAAHRLPIKLDY